MAPCSAVQASQRLQSTAAWPSHCQVSPSAVHLPVSSFDFRLNQFRNPSTLKHFKEALDSNFFTHRKERSNNNGVSGTRLVRAEGSQDHRDFARMLKEGNGGRRSNGKPRDLLAGHLSLGLVRSLATKSGEWGSPTQVVSCGS